MPDLSLPTFLLFVGTCLSLLATLVVAVLRSSGGSRGSVGILAAMGLWLLAIGVPASFGFFENFDTLPPRIALIILPMLAFWVWLSVSRAGLRLSHRFTLPFLVGVQVFRVAVEVFLFWAYQEGRIPVEMTFEGYNYDILVGLSAPVAAYLAYSSAKTNAGKYNILLMGWNIAGMLILSVVVYHGLGGAPTRFQWLHLSPAPAIIGRFPYVYLPGLLVMSAFALHILSIRKLRVLGKSNA